MAYDGSLGHAKSPGETRNTERDDGWNAERNGECWAEEVEEEGWVVVGAEVEVELLVKAEVEEQGKVEVVVEEKAGDEEEGG